QPARPAPAGPEVHVGHSAEIRRIRYGAFTIRNQGKLPRGLREWLIKGDVRAALCQRDRCQQDATD
ncbi:MAG: hypothetical protein ACPH51_06775, partial [Luminiphilus sp.]